MESKKLEEAIRENPIRSSNQVTWNILIVSHWEYSDSMPLLFSRSCSNSSSRFLTHAIKCIDIVVVLLLCPTQCSPIIFLWSKAHPVFLRPGICPSIRIFGRECVFVHLAHFFFGRPPPPAANAFLNLQKPHSNFDSPLLLSPAGKRTKNNSFAGAMKQRRSSGHRDMAHGKGLSLCHPNTSQPRPGDRVGGGRPAGHPPGLFAYFFCPFLFSPFDLQSCWAWRRIAMVMSCNPDFIPFAFWCVSNLPFDNQPNFM